MLPFFRTVIMVVACGAGFAWASDDYVGVGTLGGFICVRPLPPACAARDETFKSGSAIRECQDEVERFAAATAAYRECMQGQLAHAIRAANEVIARFRCLSKAGACPDAAARP